MLFNIISANDIHKFNKATYYIVTWSDLCITKYPISKLAVKNSDAIALWDTIPMIVSTWNNEFLYETMGNSTSIEQSILPMSIIDFRSCVIECNKLEEPQIGYFETMLGNPRYGLFDAYRLLNICLAKTYNKNIASEIMIDLSHLKVILNAPLFLNSGFYISSQIHISNLIIPINQPITKYDIRTWAGVLLHEVFHGLGIGHARAPQVGALTDIQDEYGMYNDIMGTWVDHGFGHTHFLNGAHMFALGFATPVNTVLNIDPIAFNKSTITFILPVMSPTRHINTSATIAIIETREGTLVFDAIVINNDDTIIPFGISGNIISEQIYIRIFMSPNPPIQDFIPPVDLVALIPLIPYISLCVNLNEWIAPSKDGTYIRGKPPQYYFNSEWTVVFMLNVCVKLLEFDNANITCLGDIIN
jgi:hypothetical protein